MEFKPFGNNKIKRKSYLHSYKHPNSAAYTMNFVAASLKGVLYFKLDFNFLKNISSIRQL